MTHDVCETFGMAMKKLMAKLLEARAIAKLVAKER